MMARSNSVKHEDVGEQREVWVSLNQNRASLSVTRYFTEREKELKRESLRKRGKRCHKVPQFSAQQLDKAAVQKIVALKDDIQQKIDLIEMGENLTQAQSMIQLTTNLYLTLDADNLLAHIRRYWWSAVEHKWLPFKSKYHFAYDMFFTYIFYFKITFIKRTSMFLSFIRRSGHLTQRAGERLASDRGVLQ